ncbi:MAG TPA: Na+/H+ antiporter NhaA [Planctomycetota bacterium]|nr:Na+/H+ antiporter NhaA [Planctomycetota bacterium]
MSLPREPVDRLLGPLQRFLHIEAASGVLLLVATVAALVAANSPWADGFLGFFETKAGIRFGGFVLEHSLRHWINDALMAIFFFVIGLEVKREVVLGELSDLRAAALPLAAAVGGMVAPAAIYLALQAGGPGASGWGVPMATDIAFVVGCMAVLGRRVPNGLRVMLLSLAIADDIGAILVIAIGYTASIDWIALGLGVVGIGAIVALQRLGVRRVSVYAVVGMLVWFAFHASGVHATIAGVILGWLTPIRPWIDESRFEAIVNEGGAGGRTLEIAARESRSPLARLENALHPWVGFLIMPLFALANAGVKLSPSAFGEPVALAAAAGLVVGKPLGILAFSWAAVKARLARLPEGVGWGAVAAGGALAGIGFTMSLFIAGLALPADLLDAAKVGILGASAVAAAAGMAALRLRKQPGA